MPTPDQILMQLTSLAWLGRGVAVLWHLSILLLLWAVWSGRWIPERRLGAMMVTAPLFTAGVFAASVGNPFNAVMLVVTAVVLIALGARLGTRPTERSVSWATAIGGGAIAYALVYPHFLPRGLELSFWMAPVGVIPCPSLALVLGFGLVAGGFGSRAWSAVAAVVGTFYALFGMFRLGVWLDLGLLIAAVSLAVLIFVPFGRTHGTPHPAT